MRRQLTSQLHSGLVWVCPAGLVVSGGAQALYSQSAIWVDSSSQWPPAFCQAWNSSDRAVAGQPKVDPSQDGVNFGWDSGSEFERYSPVGGKHHLYYKSDE
jgi:hypothetical protein